MPHESLTTPTLPADRRVLVIGAGPVGQTAALLLAHWGVPVTLLDSRPERDPIGSKALCQQRDVLDVWDHVGAGRQVADEGVTWTRARTFYRDTELFCQGFVDKGRSPFPPFVNISQTRTEQLLDEQIARSDLISYAWGHHVVGLRQGADSVTLTCETSSGPVDLTGSYAVAAPGSKGGPIRDLLGLTFDGLTFDDQFLICDIRADMPGWEQERRFYFDPEWNPGRQVLIHPCPDSTFRIDWQVPPDFSLEEDEASGGLDRRIRQIIGADSDYEIVWKSLYRFHARQVDRMRVGRVLVAGDAAHLVSPFGARGLNSGVLDAENAAWKLAFVLHGWADESLLDSYHSERHAAAAENLEVTSRTMAFLVPQTPEEHARRLDILEESILDPERRNQVDSGRLSEPFWYTDSELTTPAPDRPWPGRPPKGEDPEPVPGVLVPDVPLTGWPGVCRLRELARRGLLVLVGRAVDRDACEDAVAELGCGVTVVALDAVDPDGVVAASLHLDGRQAVVIRPDAHLAAIVATPGEVGAAVRRVLRR
ncbi:FAD-dependent monooxygenase [Arsenicicoccus sp. oral taxon 190]|uniref:FAD-dependent monooxygenase n=1 Tax=Arsenicicoccus sp. oral taxon 190 TaxID=1658671 RepID=UPI000679EDAA|nr:FAD-dependent monooxygenase [Arsenicicoccus sp. oral taxon 190]AKT50701.1 pentachlorophenol monooxygenase [Arsenicicoccus sp. oral taxon 190]